MITNMLLHVIAVECVGPRKLRVWFDDDTVKDVDFTGELWGEVFEPLKDPEFFAGLGEPRDRNRGMAKRSRHGSWLPSRTGCLGLEGIVDMPHSFAIVPHMVFLTISTFFSTNSTGPTVNQHARPRRRPPTDRPLPRERARPVLRGEIR